MQIGDEVLYVGKDHSSLSRRVGIIERDAMVFDQVFVVFVINDISYSIAIPRGDLKLERAATPETIARMAARQGRRRTRTGTTLSLALLAVLIVCVIAWSIPWRP